MTPTRCNCTQVLGLKWVMRRNGFYCITCGMLFLTDQEVLALKAPKLSNTKDFWNFVETSATKSKKDHTWQRGAVTPDEEEKGRICRLVRRMEDRVASMDRDLRKRERTTDIIGAAVAFGFALLAFFLIMS